MKDRDGNLIVEAYSCGCYTVVYPDAVYGAHCSGLIDRVVACGFRSKHKI